MIMARMERSVAPTFIDLFAGAGLFSAGMMRAGFNPVLAIDLDREAVASYCRNVSPCAVRGSVTDATAVPKADVLIAGPPCQGFSTLGRRDPTDIRNDLSLAILPWIEAASPSLVVVENVPPFLRSAQWRRLARRLGSLGFRIQTWELEAFEFGTPQLRRRAFTVASRIGTVPRPQAGSLRISAGDALFAPIVPDDPMHRWPTPAGIAAERIVLVPPNGDKRDIMRDRPDLCPPSWARVGCQATDVWGRINPSEPANTLRCTFQNPSKGRYLHPFENRCLSLREGARLQGVPDSWIFEGKNYPVARQIGNGVPIPLATAVAVSLAQVFSQHRDLVDKAA
ncbi:MULTISPECIES: DNA cytosine methyltransferase [unclassified Bosea (in: a-proteobacteria)]|uniref:DNA cytosine methyltransferase n=1 Tax=unclassified Bosea (in: a-proteobacteria) TaxID=2653178 RepID=UPI0013E94C41|nr:MULTISPECIES: DNA cytosine methyltransferase [unclassified Bosea (in: a-proteobacteria)]